MKYTSLVFRKMAEKFRFLWLLLSFVNAYEESSVVELTDANVDQVLDDNDAVVINFYANWCPYSEMFKPHFLEAGKLLREIFGTGDLKAVAASIDCVAQSNLEARFGVSKYPTMKLSLHGKVLENEYRGKRDAKSILSYVEGYLTNSTMTLNASADFDQIAVNEPVVITYITRPNNDAHKMVQKVAAWMKDSCHVYVTHVADRLPLGMDLAIDHVFLKEEEGHFSEYTDDLSKGDNLYEWLKRRCQPTVKELTFENAEELSEPGIPFLVLFRGKDDARSLQLYKSAVKRELVDFLPYRVRTLIADGNVFVHPLHQAGKSEADLPVILLDSFVHMYVFKKFKNVEIPGKLKQFMEDFESEKLHQDYHEEEMSKLVNSIGNDNYYFQNDDDYFQNDVDDSLEETNVTEQTQSADNIDRAEKTFQSEDELSAITSTRTPTTPPESAFKYLQPSKHRYTFKRDEL